MPLIPYPNVPNYPGVPAIPRTAPGSPDVSVSLSNVNATIPDTVALPTWGIFDSSNNAIFTPSDSGTVSTFSVAFMRSMNISDFPIEANANAPGQGASFASFNKVWQPANPIIVLAISGSGEDLSGFLTAIDAACQSTNLYTVVTPDAQYVDYSIEGYTYQRTARRGATMLMVEISLKEILQVRPSYGQGAPSSINNPQSSSATPQSNGGLVQATTPYPFAINGAPILGLNN